MAEKKDILASIITSDAERRIARMNAKFQGKPEVIAKKVAFIEAETERYLSALGTITDESFFDSASISRALHQLEDFGMDTYLELRGAGDVQHAIFEATDC